MRSSSQLCSDPQTFWSVFFFHFLTSGQTPDPVHWSYNIHQTLTYASLLRSSTFGGGRLSLCTWKPCSLTTPLEPSTSKTLPGSVTCSSVTLLFPNVFPIIYPLKVKASLGVHISNVRKEYKDLVWICTRCFLPR